MQQQGNIIDISIRHDDNALARIIADELLSVPMRLEAVRFLLKREYIIDLLLMPLNGEVRAALLHRVDDNFVLITLALDDAAAVQKLSEQTVIRQVAQEDDEPQVRLAAIACLEDQQALSQIASFEPLAELRLAAVMRLSDTARLAMIAATDDATEVRELAQQRLREVEQGR